MNQFNKTLFLKYLKDLNLDNNDFIIVAGGSLLLQNIKDSTEDIDLYVNQKAFDELAKKYKIIKSNKPYPNHYIVNENLEVVLKDNLEELDYVLIDGYKCSTLEYEYLWKKKNNRQKDQEIIKKLEDVLNICDIL